MPQEIINILLAALCTAITGLVGWAVATLTSWLNSKIKNDKFARFMSTIFEITGNAVREISQTYVDAIKKEGKFDEEAQKKALEMCLSKVKTQLAPEVLDFIGKNFGDVTEYLKSLIESTIYSMKQH